MKSAQLDGGVDIVHLIPRPKEQTMSADVRVAEAADLSRKAAEIAGKLKAGGWESAQTLALISIAKSLVVLADQVQNTNQGRDS